MRVINELIFISGGKRNDAIHSTDVLRCSRDTYNNIYYYMYTTTMDVMMILQRGTEDTTKRGEERLGVKVHVHLGRIYSIRIKKLIIWRSNIPFHILVTLQ